MKKILVLFVFLLTCCSTDNKKSPLSWCLWEISKHEDYSEFEYCYQELYSYNIESQTTAKNYRIITYTVHKETVWLCYIEYQAKGYSETIKSNQVIKIDCDIAYIVSVR